LDIIKLGSLYSLKIYLTKYLATKIVLIKSIETIYCIFIRRSTITIIFVNLLLLSKSTIKSIEISCYFYIGIGNSQSTPCFFYVRSLSINACFIYSDIFSYIVVYYRPVICSLNYFICFYTAKISYYKRIIYKFKYFKL
jgi:hypothetical protein